MGYDLRTGQPVAEEVVQAFSWTLQLTIAAEIIAVSIGLLAGIYAAKKQNTWIDAGIMSSSLWLASMPSFWLGLVLILIFSAWLKLTPVSGYGGLHYLILPALALGLGQMGILARFTRSSFLDVIRQDYIRAAKARGLSDRMITFQHALRNAFAPIITVIGLQLGYLLGGAFFVEIIFGWPGVGRLAFRAISERNFPLLQGAVLVVSVSFVLINAVVDIIQAYVDPRVQSEINREAS